MGLVWHWPQVVVAGLYVLGVGGAMFMHGKPKRPERWDGYRTIVYTGLGAGLLYAGGFWTGGQ